jgi:hypothetical protein
MFYHTALNRVVGVITDLLFSEESILSDLFGTNLVEDLSVDLPLSLPLHIPLRHLIR